VRPDHPVTAHSGVPDPAAVTDDGAGAQMLALRHAFRMLEQRITLFVALPLVALDQMALEARLRRLAVFVRPDTAEDRAS
jgi:arsenate reductase